MALQVNLGTVQLTNGSPTVRHEWKLNMATGAPGTFAVGDAVTWPGSGAGTVGAWDSVSRILHVARTAGANPAAGTVVTGPSGNSTVSSVAPTSPPNWNAKVTLPAVATFERHYTDYNVLSVAADSFVLTTNYLGANARVSEYGLNTDFTSLGLGIVRPGDVGATAIITRSMVRLNALLTRGAAELQLSSNLALSAGGDVAINWQTEVEDTGGLVVGVPTTVMTMPSGISKVDVGCSIKLTAGLGGTTPLLNIRLLKNAVIIAEQSLVALMTGANLYRGALSVVAGDTLSVRAVTSATGTFNSIQAGASTNFWARIAQVT